MFTKKTPAVKTDLEVTIDTLFLDMLSDDTDSKEYAQRVDQMVKLYGLKDVDRPKTVSPDTMMLAGANLLGILLILNFERAGVMASKAGAFVLKLR